MLGRPEVVAMPVHARWRHRLRDWMLRGIYHFGWRIAARLPRRLVAVIISAISWMALRHDGVHVRTLRHNLALTTGAPVHRDLLRAAVNSYLRNFYEVLALPAWSETEIRRRVCAVNEPAVRGAHAGPGVVVALPHSGNWDLAGAWAEERDQGVEGPDQGDEEETVIISSSGFRTGGAGIPPAPPAFVRISRHAPVAWRS
jgi:lauroyl/myristoyl acyltransferase